VSNDNKRLAVIGEVESFKYLCIFCAKDRGLCRRGRKTYECGRMKWREASGVLDAL